MLHKATGLFSQEKIRNRMREVFCRKNPFRPSTRKTKAEMMRTVPAPELSVTCTAMAWLLVEGVLPAALSPNAHRKGGQKEPGWLLRGGDGAFVLVPALPLPGKDKHGLSLYRGLEPWCTETSSHLSQLSPHVDPAEDPGQIERCSTGRVGSCGQPRCASQRQMGFHKRRFMTH